jgi:predicted nucleotide-binding protein (sugar kinase/HSP70/actin superfamily)
MVEMVGLDIKTTFHEYALKAEKTPIVDETCGVFTESGIASLIAMGFPKEEIAAAIAYGFMGGYVNKFVGNEKFGDYASAQGGPFNGKSCLAALALHTGMEIHAFPHRQLFGALGAVIAVSNEIKRMESEGVEFESKFRGLDLADMKFEKKVENCSKIINDTCGLRDCQLQVYKVGDDSIYSGGLCPKGNTDASTKRAPNYVDTYKRILEKHLKKYSISLEDDTEKERILIPRSLTFLNEKGVFYTAFYKALGFDVCISPESDDNIANIGIKYSHSETCYPVKLAHGHAGFLKKHLRKGKDKILMVNVIGAGQEKYRFCPYVGGAGFIVKDALHIKNKDVLLPVVYFNDPDYPMEENMHDDLNRVFKGRFSQADIKKCVKKAEEAEKKFLEDVYATGEKIVVNLKEKGINVFIGIGRGYTILDDKASSKVHELFASCGLHFVPAFFLKTPKYRIDKISDNMYWYQGQSMIKYNLMTAIDPKLYGVRETNFNCGTDSFLLYHEESIMSRAEKPHLVLQTDGHNSNAQFGTRTLANYEVVKKHKPKKVRIDDFKKILPEPEMKNRLLGIPYMGDNSNTLAAALRGAGFNVEVMPTYTKKAQEMARKFVSTNTCRPFSFQIGDQLAWVCSLKERGMDPNNEAAVFHPTTKGPCRLGQYPVMLRKFLDEMGFDKVPVISPDAEHDYNNMPIPKPVLLKISTIFYKGVFCHDVLYDALLRTRPYERIKGSTDKVYNAMRNKLYHLVEERASTKKLKRFMRKAKEKFESVLDKSKKRKPLVAMNGEIFVRSHPKSNQDSIKLLEKYGLEVMLGSISQWTSYVNRYNIRKHIDSRNVKGVFLSLLKSGFIKNISYRLYAPFAEYLEGRKAHDPEHLLEASQKDLVYERRIGGEAPLSIGEAHLFSKGDLNDISGIYHVGPFGCMQETVATSKIHSIIHKRRRNAKEMHEKIVPFMDGVFGDSELPNLEAEIAAFAEKCYLKRELTKAKKSS